MSRPPIRHRLRNPPPHFVGRDRERAAVLAALGETKVVIVTGPGGIGKTSLVSSAIHALGERAVAHTLTFAVASSDVSGAGLLLELLSALSFVVDGRAMESRALADLEGAVAMCIDLADILGAIIVIDDVHHAEADLCRALFSGASAYARASRWVATSRLPLADWDGAFVPLTGLSSEAIATLARRELPTLDAEELDAVVRDVKGSPFWLKQRIAIGRDASAGTALLDRLSERSVVLMSALALLEVPIPTAFLPVLGVDSALSTELTELGARGLIEVSPGGYSLHAVAKSALAHGRGADAIAESLARTGDPALVAEAVRLLLAHGSEERASDVVDEHLASLLDAGLASKLWDLLASRTSARFIRAKLRVAENLGGGASLVWAKNEPRPSDPMARLAWLVCLGVGGELGRVADEGVEMAGALSSTEPEFAREAGLSALRSMVSGGNITRALEWIVELRVSAVSDPIFEALVDAWEARARVFTGEESTALALVTSVAGRAREAPAAAQREIENQRAAVLMNLGRMKSAHAAYERANAVGLVTREQLGARERLVRASLFALEFGELDDARAKLDELEPVAKRSEELHAFFRMNEFRYASARGALDVAERHLESLERAVRESHSGYWSAWVASPRHYLGVLAARPFDEAAAAKESDFPLTRALGAWHAVSAGASTARLDRERRTDIVDTAIVLGLAHSRAALLRGDFTSAIAEAERSVFRAEEEGLALWEADARCVLIEVLFLADSPRERRALAAMEAHCARLGATRFDGELAFFAALSAARSSHDVSKPESHPRSLTQTALVSLERLSRSASEPALAHARRSLAVLGANPSLDAVDALIVAKAKALLVVDPLERNAHPGLGLDAASSSVWRPDGAMITLASRPTLMKLLLTIFDRGGSASKEELVKAVWGIEEYHPLRDDKRLQVAVRRLRVLLEIDPNEPRLLETTASGYRFTKERPVYRV